MDHDELRKVKLIFTSFFVFVVSGFTSCNEIRYSLFGEKTEARIVEMKRIREGRSPRESLSISYVFNDKKRGDTRENDTVSLDYPVPESSVIPIEYFPGEVYSSRIAGNTNHVWIVIFVVSLAVFIGFIVKLAVEAQEPSKDRKRARRLKDRRNRNLYGS